MLLLRQELDSPALRAELMRACKVPLLYDGLFEAQRAPYLHRLIRAAGQERHFVRELSRWLLAEAGPEDDGIDAAQAFHVLCLLAADDATFDRAVLHDFVRKATYDMTGVSSTCAFIQLEGTEALLLYVRRFADSIADENESWSFKCLVEALGERDGVEAAASFLEAARATCPELDRLMALDPDAAFAEESAAPRMDYATAKDVLAAGGALFPRAWTRDATPEELAQAASDLLAERDVRKLRAYLALFRRRAFPGPASSLFPFVRHEDEPVADVAAGILGRLGGGEVRALGWGLVDGPRPGTGIRMLRGETAPEVFEHIDRRLDLSRPLDAAGWHSVGHAVMDLLMDVEVAPLASRGVLLRLYEEEPCSFCRTIVVRHLAESEGGLPAWMVEECLHDAEPDVVDLASRASAGRG